MDRLGARDMELAVWEIPHDLEDREELPAVLDACEQLWREHILSKMAVPEVSAMISVVRSVIY